MSEDRYIYLALSILIFLNHLWVKQRIDIIVENQKVTMETLIDLIRER